MGPQSDFFLKKKKNTLALLDSGGYMSQGRGDKSEDKYIKLRFILDLASNVRISPAFTREGKILFFFGLISVNCNNNNNNTICTYILSGKERSRALIESILYPIPSPAQSCFPILLNSFSVPHEAE